MPQPSCLTLGTSPSIGRRSLCGTRPWPSCLPVRVPDGRWCWFRENGSAGLEADDQGMQCFCLSLPRGPTTATSTTFSGRPSRRLYGWVAAHGRCSQSSWRSASRARCCISVRVFHCLLMSFSFSTWVALLCLVLFVLGVTAGKVWRFNTRREPADVHRDLLSRPPSHPDLECAPVPCPPDSVIQLFLTEAMAAPSGTC